MDIKAQDFKKQIVMLGNIVSEPEKYMTVAMNKSSSRKTPLILELTESAPFLTSNASQVEKQIQLKKFIGQKEWMMLFRVPRIATIIFENQKVESGNSAAFGFTQFEGAAEGPRRPGVLAAKNELVTNVGVKGGQTGKVFSKVYSRRRESNRGTLMA